MRLAAFLIGAALAAGCAQSPPAEQPLANPATERAAEAAGDSDAYLFDEAPKPLKMVRPEYPEAARQEALEGLVVLRVTIAPDGSVSEASAVRSDHDILIAPAVTAVRQWKFEPARRDGKPVASTVTIPLRFALE